MARPRKYTTDELLDAAAEILAADGPAAVTVAAVGARTGAPNGSIYHRFGSRDQLVAHLWVRTVRRFQAGFLAALTGDDVDHAAIDAATHVVSWSRAHTREAALLFLYRRSQLAATYGDELGAELATLDDAVGRALRDHTRARYGSEDALDRVMFAVVDVPYAACRRALAAGRAPSPGVEALVADTVAHVLGMPLHHRSTRESSG